ncbi:MAG: hypothetical protein K0V04_14785, partial [Deltaproteobacteria bacterium]|nr:hypothetical protein [Deltaproteobacteria bacterium]
MPSMRRPTPPPLSLTARLLQLWTLRDRDQAWMGWLGLALLASGVLHIGVQLITGDPWAGPVSWRKPIVFGLSGGLTTLSLGWAIGALSATRWRRITTRAFVVAMALEVGLITLQAWRGVASHFNIATPTDIAVWSAMGVLVGIIAVVVAIWTVQLWRQRLPCPADHVARRHG